MNDIDLQAINQVRAEHVAGVTAGDLQAVLAGMAENVVFLPTSHPSSADPPWKLLYGRTTNSSAINS